MKSQREGQDLNNDNNRRVTELAVTTNSAPDNQTIAPPELPLEVVERIMFFATPAVRKSAASASKEFNSAAKRSWKAHLQRDYPVQFARDESTFNDETNYAHLYRLYRRDLSRAILQAMRPNIHQHPIQWTEFCHRIINEMFQGMNLENYEDYTNYSLSDEQAGLMRHAILAGYDPIWAFRVGKPPKHVSLMSLLLKTLRNHEQLQIDCKLLLQCVELLLNLGFSNMGYSFANIFEDVASMGDLRIEVINIFRNCNYQFTDKDYIFLLTSSWEEDDPFLARLDAFQLPESIRNKVLCEYIEISNQYSYEGILTRALKCRELIRMYLTDHEYLSLIAQQGAVKSLDDFAPTAEDLTQKIKGTASPIELALCEESRVLLPRMLRSPGTFTLEPETQTKIIKFLKREVHDYKECRFYLYLMLIKGFSVNVLKEVLCDYEFRSEELLKQFQPVCHEAQTSLKEAIIQGNTSFVEILGCGGANLLSIDGGTQSAAEFALFNGKFEIAKQLAAITLKLINVIDPRESILTKDKIFLLEENLPPNLQLLLPLCDISRVGNLGLSFFDSYAHLAKIPGIEKILHSLLPQNYDFKQFSPGTLNLIQAACLYRNENLLRFLLKQDEINLEQLTVGFNNRDCSLIFWTWLSPLRTFSDVEMLRSTVTFLREQGLQMSEEEVEILQTEFLLGYRRARDVNRAAKAILEELHANPLAKQMKLK